MATVWPLSWRHPQVISIGPRWCFPALQDMGWQMAVRHLNTAKLYFGGDIAKTVADDNARRYRAHATGIPERFLGPGSSSRAGARDEVSEPHDRHEASHQVMLVKGTEVTCTWHNKSGVIDGGMSAYHVGPCGTSGCQGEQNLAALGSVLLRSAQMVYHL